MWFLDEVCERVAPCPPRSQVRVCAAAVAPQKVLIVNTNGGGHANIGFWLAKTLAGKGGQLVQSSTLSELLSYVSPSSTYDAQAL
jgi:hypothetical protein